jgi:signal transduction histidine kinase
MTATTVGRTAGWAPQWWRSGVRTRMWWTAAVLALGWQAVVGPYVDQHRFGLVTAIPWLYAWVTAGLVAEILVGLLFWMWRPQNVVGPLLVAWAALSSLSGVPSYFPHSRLALTFCLLFAWVFLALYVWMLFAFPNGTIWNRWALAVLVVFSVWQLLIYLPGLLFTPTGPAPLFSALPSDVPSYFYLGHGWSGLDAWDDVFWVGQAVLWVLVDLVLIARLWQATPGARRRLLPLYGVVIVKLTFDFSYHAVHEVQDKPWAAWFPYVWFACFGVSAAGAAYGLGRVRHARASVSDLVVELGEVEPGRVRDALARTLGDPSLVLGLWLPDRGVWTDEQGQELTIPTDGSRGVTYVGERLAVLVHDRDLLDQPRLLESVGSAARLALENERLQAQLRAQLEELRESRARIVKAGDEERRRLERDLHDGAQQRLLALGMGLQLLKGHVDDASEELLSENQRELRHALKELRELAQGIHPAALTDNGLGDAVRTLAQRAPVPVDVQVDEGMGRLPGPVETAAYFVVAEALANVAKYADASEAWVTVGRENGNAHVEIRDDGRGGATPDGGSGLRGLTDRVGALDGQLTIESTPEGGTRIIAEIPCAS